MIFYHDNNKRVSHRCAGKNGLVCFSKILPVKHQVELYNHYDKHTCSQLLNHRCIFSSFFPVAAEMLLKCWTKYVKEPR